MPGKDYTDFLERWYYLRPNAPDKKRDLGAQSEPEKVTEQEQVADSKQSNVRETEKVQKAEAVMRGNEQSRRDQLGPGC